MKIKQQRVYTLHDAPVLTSAEFNEALHQHVSQPIPANASYRIGWMPPLGWAEPNDFFYTAGDFVLLRAVVQEKKLPPGEMTPRVRMQIAKKEAAGETVTEEEAIRIEQQVRDELLARAFPKESHVLVIWDNATSRISVCTGAAPEAERVLSLLRLTLGSLKVTPLSANDSLAMVATGWLKAAPVPEGIQLDSDAVLKTTGEPGQVTIRNEDLLADEIYQMVCAGRYVVNLRLRINDEVVVTVGKDLEMKRIEYTKGLLERLEEEAFAKEEPDIALQADFIITANALRAATDTLLLALGGDACGVTEEEEEAVEA